MSVCDSFDPVREMSLGAALLMYTAIGTASAVGLIGLIGVIYLVRRATKKGKYIAKKGYSISLTV